MRAVACAIATIMAGAYFGMTIYQATQGNPAYAATDGAVMGAFIAIASITKDDR